MGKYDGFDAWFAAQPDDEVTVAIADLAREAGIALPASATAHAAWWGAGQPNARWVSLGWRAHPDLARAAVRFTRDGHVRPEPPTATATGELLLLGCVKTKRGVRSAAKDLYDSTLWRGRRAYAERSGRPWAILSAKHGLVAPDEVLEPYDLHLASLSTPELREWSQRVAPDAIALAHRLGARSVEIHAGEEYVVYGLQRALERAGLTVVRPLQGVPLGQQLAWYGAPASQPLVTSSEPAGTLVADLVQTYTSGALGGAWHDLPEVRYCPDAPAIERRRFLLFVAGLDRARDAEALWRKAHELWVAEPWTFDPVEVCRRPVHDLAEVLRASGVSQRHLLDAVGWRLVAEALADPTCPAAIQDALAGRPVQAAGLLAAFGAAWPEGTSMFPYVAGPKVGPMLVRMLVFPGGAQVSGLGAIPVAVDTHVQRASEALGLVPAAELDDRHRSSIQRAWFDALARADGGYGGPPELDGTAAGLDPALWDLGRRGCKSCVTSGARSPVGPVCAHCTWGPG